ncbi:hypothetical protein B0T20DRAFT_423283 [Sordaria brevicollis]|uniref:Uncharacterized protein n=1 Tax=Sordaria brevicollis TaxID=83679 RepID=A0AAE0P2S3_SORBR|nr:hypothetical protein B0T20DRAFT_423283 [Sordaria brevicollis]
MGCRWNGGESPIHSSTRQLPLNNACLHMRDAYSNTKDCTDHIRCKKQCHCCSTEMALSGLCVTAMIWTTIDTGTIRAATLKNGWTMAGWATAWSHSLLG